MELETAQASLVGDRAENQDRAEILIGDEATFAIVADGMGGHADGARAADTAISSLAASFRRTRGKPAEPAQFLGTALARAHAAVLALGEDMALEVKPGTIVVCALILDTTMWWAHVGDSRVYHLRAGKLLARTRDHTKVEALLEAGEITPAQAEQYRNRHMVEYCLGVVPDIPPLSLDETMTLRAGDIVLLCSDGLWGQLEESALLDRLRAPEDLDQTLQDLVELAAENAGPHSDNVTAIALRAHADPETTR